MYLVNLPMPEACCMCPINVWNTCKALRGKGNRDNIVEEMADVLVGTGQMLVMFDAEAETLVAKENKLKRLVQRLNDGTA